MLVQNGANIDARDGFFYTPLHLACVNGAVACVDVLLRAGADPGPAAQGGVTPLIAARKPEVRELVKEALATRKSSLWEIDISGQSAVDGGYKGGERDGQAGAKSGEGEDAAVSTAADLAAAIAAVLATSGAAGGTNTDSDVGESGTTRAGCRGEGDAEKAPAFDYDAKYADSGRIAAPRGRPVSRLPREKEARRSGTSARPRRSSTGTMLQKIFNSSSGPYQPHSMKDEVAAVTTAAQLVSISPSSTESGDSPTLGTGAAPMEGSGIPSPAQMVPETPLHLAPRRPSSPPRLASTNAAAAAAEKIREIKALELPQFVGVPLNTASVPAFTPRVVSAEDGDVEEATDAFVASTESLSAPDGAESLGSPGELAPAPVTVTNAGAVRDGAGVAMAAAAAVAVATNTPPAVAVARTEGGGEREDDELAAAPLVQVRAKKRRAKSLPPSSRKDRRPRGPRPCLEGPAAVIKTLTPEDDDDDDVEAWALGQWLHGAATSVTADGGGDSPALSPTVLPVRRATTLVG